MGYQVLEAPIRIEITRSQDRREIQVEATVDGIGLEVDDKNSSKEEETNNDIARKVTKLELVKNDTEADQIKISVINDLLYSLPNSGGSGIFLYILSGIVLMMAASYLYWKKVSRLGKRRYKNAIFKKSLCQKPPFFLLGCNMTRIKSDSYINFMKYIFKGLHDICFRDKYSLNYFHLKNTRYAPDLVFNYPLQHYKKKKKVVISVWGCLTKCDEMPQWKWAEDQWKSYKCFIINIIEYFNDIDYQIELLSLCESEGDLQACELIKKETRTKKLTILNYKGNTDEVVCCISEASFVVGTRFHSVVLALSSKTSVYPIIYESKTLQLLKDCEFTGEYSEVAEIKSDEISKVIKSFERHCCYDGIDAIKLKARDQFIELNKVLRKGYSDES